VEGEAPRRLTSVPRSPRLAGTRPSLFLLAESGTGRFKRHDLRHIPARRFYQSLITSHQSLLSSRPRPRSRTPSRRRNTPRCRGWPWSSCGCRSRCRGRCWSGCYCGGSRRCWRRCNAGRNCRCRCRPARWRNPHIIHVFFMLPAGRIEVECGRIRHVATSVVGHDRNVIAYLILHRVAFERSKRITHRDVGRPCHAAVSAPGVKQL